MTDEQSRRIERHVELLTQSINATRETLSREMGQVTTAVDGLQKEQGRLVLRVDKLAEDQAGCPARGGIKGVNARLANLETGERERVADELIRAREDATGQHDVPPRGEPAHRHGSIAPGALVSILSLFRPVVVLIVSVAICIGVYLGSGGDEERTAAVLDRVIQVTGQLQKQVAEIQTSPALQDAPQRPVSRTSTLDDHMYPQAAPPSTRDNLDDQDTDR